MPLPEHSPLGGETGRIARAVQAYAYSLENGGTQAQAERAAGHFVEQHKMPEIARMAYGALRAAAAFGFERAGVPYRPGGRNYEQYRSGLAAAAQEGGEKLLATVVYYYTPPETGVPGPATMRRSSVVQVDLPLGATFTEAQRIMEEAAIGAAESNEYGYVGAFLGFSVLTILEH